jgi:hypothetical protein
LDPSPVFVSEYECQYADQNESINRQIRNLALMALPSKELQWLTIKSHADFFTIKRTGFWLPLAQTYTLIYTFQ